MAEVRTILQLGHPILRQTALRITDLAQPQLHSLIADLLTTAQSANGVGMAAPQVGESCRLFVIASRPNPRYPDAPWMTPTPLLNPRLIAHGEVVVKDWESCLSLPQLRGLVPRYREIEVEYWDAQGKLQLRVFRDFLARIFQHELDHLNGILFLQRLESPADLYLNRGQLSAPESSLLNRCLSLPRR